jgi:uncharacterized protein YbjT (DUF2867 family)
MFFVTGATGNVGRHVVESLLGAGAKVRALTRNPRAAGLPEGAEVVVGDLGQDPRLPATALEGVEAVFLNPAAVGGATAEFLELARRQGVRRVVVLSSASVQDGLERQHGPIAERHKLIEEVVEASGLEWTHLRPGEFAANALFQWAPQIRATGVVRGAYGMSAVAPIHERDIADVAVRALVDAPAHAGARYELSGPEPLTQYEKVRLIGEAVGRPLRFEEIPPEEARRAMVERGLPAEVADVLLGYQAATVERPGPVSPVVREVTGHPGRTFARWAAEHAAAFSG